MTADKDKKSDSKPDNFMVDVIDDMIDTTIVLDDGSRVRILMDERTVARVVLAYRAALERLHAQRGQNRPQKPE